MKKFLRRSGFVLLFLLTFILLAYAVESWRGARAWTNEQARLQQRGEALTWPELLGPAPTPEDNFAASPLFDGMYEYQQTRDAQGRERFEWKGGPALNRLSDSLRLPNPLQTESRTDGIPGVDLATVVARFQASTNWGPHPNSGQPARDLLTYLATRQTTFDQLAEAGRRPATRFPLRYEDGDLALLPHLAYLKSAAGGLKLRALARAGTGDADGAARDIELILRLARATGADPLLISSLVQVALESIACTTFWQGWRDDVWGEEQLALLQAGFASINTRSNTIQALRGERIFSSAYYDILREDPTRIAGAYVGAEGSPYGALLFRLMPTGWVRQNQANHSRLIDDLVRHLQERPEGRALSLDRPPFAQQLNNLPVVYSIFPRMLVRPIESTVTKADRSLAITQLTVLVCALERHRIAHQSYPATLDTLVPRFLPRVPVDPIDGQPLRYSLKPDGTFVLYSIGLDARDNDGDVGNPKQEAPDWVWPQRNAGPAGRFF